MPTDPNHLHQRRTSDDTDEEDPIVAQLGADCSKVYAKLEDCLAESDRDWRRCQKEVQALKACHEKAAASKKSPPPPLKK